VILHNTSQSNKVIVQKYYGTNIFVSVVINNKIICTYRLDFIEQNVELVGNGINTIIELINENSAHNLLSNTNKDKFYFQNDLFSDYDYLFEYINEHNIDINKILKNNERITIKKKYMDPVEINNISENNKKKILLPTQILNLKYYEIKYFI
jgi:hypothetical protein